MANPEPMSLRNATSTLPKLNAKGPTVISADDPLRVWCLRALTWASVGYIVASQGLMNVPGWSSLGIIFAVAMLGILAFGRLAGIFQFKSVGWIGVSIVFVSFCVVRALPESGGDWPLEALFHLGSAFAGGIGIGLALQAGVPFKAIVWGQTITNVVNMAANSLGIGTVSAEEFEEGRSAGITGNANELALQLTLGASWIWLSPRKAGKLASWLAVGAVGYAFLAAGSRKSLLMLPVFLFLLWLQLAPAIKRHRRIAVVLITTVLLLGAGLAPFVLKESKHVVAIQRALAYQSDSSFEKRFEMTQEAVKLWRDSPILGRGTDAFRRLSFYGMYAHDNYAELLCDLGLLGTLLFYAIHGYILFKCLRLPKPLKAYCVVFVLMLMVIDVGAVSYYRKQTVMILMILASVASNPEIVVGRKRRSRWIRRNGPENATPRPVAGREKHRRYVGGAHPQM